MDESELAEYEIPRRHLLDYGPKKPRIESAVSDMRPPHPNALEERL